ncbi:MAG TPA: alpha/beta hydrolase [Xanthobacteraceae bacterium]|nr:alpha/beta hydrolase [Xanthobacteraceae bacterium]
MTTLKWLALLAVIGYAALALLLYVGQRALMYFPERTRTSPAAAGFPAAEELTLDTKDGERVIAWHVPPRGEKPVVLYFHGNGGALRHRTERFRAIVADGTGLLALSYRGYGGSSGRPSERGLLADAAAAYAFAAARYGSDRIVLWGESLGSGVAVAIAAEYPVAKVVLEAPFTSAADVAASIYWYVPVRLLMADQFRSDQRIGRVKAPVLVLHGARDRTVPIGFGERLYGMITSPKRFVRFPEGGHSDLGEFGAVDVVRAFLADH